MKVAIIGASSDRGKFGNKALRSYVSQGHTVYPVNPNEKEIEGLTAYPTIKDVPDQVDQVLFYVPPKVGITVLEGIAQKGITKIMLNPGTESREIIERAKELGLNPIQACAILAIGDSPARY